jgi:cation diffusion facilitator CzcD-associated flavoprotein CzcO
MPEPRVVVVGAGPAGLATARELRRRGIRPRILEAGTMPGHTWANLYDSLTLHTGKHLSALPGMSLGRGVPLFPTRDHFVDYLQRYVRTFQLPIETGSAVTAARPPENGGPWRLSTPQETVEADVVVFATGIVANPVTPVLPGQSDFAGDILHSVRYRSPAPFLGRRVLVVGVGNSGGEIASELADAGVDVGVAVRSGANVVPLTLAGVPIQYVAAVLWKLPASARDRAVALVRRMTELRRGPPVLPPLDGFDRIPLIGFHLPDAIQAGRVRVFPAIQSLTPEGARFVDGVTKTDSIDRARDRLSSRASRRSGGVIRTDHAASRMRTDRVMSADQAPPALRRPQLRCHGRSAQHLEATHRIAAAPRYRRCCAAERRPRSSRVRCRGPGSARLRSPARVPARRFSPSASSQHRMRAAAHDCRHVLESRLLDGVARAVIIRVQPERRERVRGNAEPCERDVVTALEEVLIRTRDRPRWARRWPRGRRPLSSARNP